MVNLTYPDGIIALREFMERNEHNFPYDKCQTTSRLMVRLDPELQEVGGKYIGRMQRHYSSHCWVYNPRIDKFVDITQDQFGDCNDKIVVLPTDTKILKLEESTTKEYRRVQDRWLLGLSDLISKAEEELISSNVISR